jgi:hypothetical protein
VIVLRANTVIDASPDSIWHFLTHLHEQNNYQHWHPANHQSFALLQGDGETVGSVFRAVELLGGKRFRLTYRLVKMERLMYLEYSATGLVGLLHPVLATFVLKPLSNDKTEFVAEVRVGYKLPVIDWLARKSVNLAAISKHMDEEGRYLNQALHKAVA